MLAAAGTALYLLEAPQQASSSSTTITSTHLSGLTMVNSTSVQSSSSYQPSSGSNITTTGNDTSPTYSASQSTENTSALFFSSASLHSSTIGLNLTLGLVGFHNGTLQIAVYEGNILGTNDNLTAANAWPYPEAQMRDYGGDCSDALLPVGMVVLKGYFDSGDFSSAKPLTIYNGAVTGTSCPAQVPIPTSYGFGPYGVGVAIYDPQYAGTYSTGISVLTSGSWTTTGSGSSLQFTRFPVGNYTVLAGDEWGQFVLLHFAVVSSSGSSTLRDNPASSAVVLIGLPFTAAAFSLSSDSGPDTVRTPHKQNLLCTSHRTPCT